MKTPDTSLLPSLLMLGAAAQLGASAASAATVVYDPSDLTVGQNGSGTGAIYFDPSSNFVSTTTQTTPSGGVAEFELEYGFTFNGSTTSADPGTVKLFLSNNANANVGTVFTQTVGGNAYVSQFGTGAMLSATTGAQSTNGTTYDLRSTGTTGNPWNLGNHGFIGLTLTSTAADTNAAVGTKLFGWAEISYNTDESVTLYRLGYDDTGAAATTPATLAPGYVVPEPGSLAAVAVLGAAGMVAFRRRRAQRPAQEMAAVDAAA